ncbi:MAG: hypothetical protein QOJ99_3269 [Bryobacterales bacterium]|nr:hypothetical protein [Bryobacterales bacterium]
MGTGATPDKVEMFVRTFRNTVARWTCFVPEHKKQGTLRLYAPVSPEGWERCCKTRQFQAVLARIADHWGRSG